MSTPHAEQLEQLLSQFEEQQRALVEVQRKLRAISATAVSPRKVVSVTAGHGGVIEEVKFPTAAYKRMAPVELAAVLTDTIAKAQRAATDEAAELMAPHMPPGIDAKAAFSGRIEDLGAMLPKSGIPEALRDLPRFQG